MISVVDYNVISKFEIDWLKFDGPIDIKFLGSPLLIHSLIYFFFFFLHFLTSLIFLFLFFLWAPLTLSFSCFFHENTSCYIP